MDEFHADNLVHECVQCGYCCTVSTCPYGQWDEEKERCANLTGKDLCKRYEEIKGLPGSDISPAFGFGCCSPLGNTLRDKKVK